MNRSVSSAQIFHPWDVWEDYKYDFYNNCTGEEKKEKINLCIEMFNNEMETRQAMFYVVSNWRKSMEHNLTNNAMNKIAYIGQAACAYYARIPSTVTMEAWSLLDEDVQERANGIAQEALDFWISNNKTIQVCLNIS